jgi:hypothetical protein
MRILFFALLAACAGADPKPDDASSDVNFVSNETSACISGHPAAEPFDVGDADMSGSGAPPALESFEAECRSAGGMNCDGPPISREAARCIAENEAFAPGLEAWNIGLAYANSYHRVVWSVENLLRNVSADDYSGQSLTLDAVSGRVLGRTNWNANQP